MFRRDSKVVQDMFDYLSAERQPPQGKVVDQFVFGRADPLVADRAAQHYWRNASPVGYILVTGGIGKDSGYLATLGIPEAKWLASLMHIKHRIPQNAILVESEARNGGENCRNGLDVLLAKDPNVDKLVVVAHATSLRRVAATLATTAPSKGIDPDIFRLATDYEFDAEKREDQVEAVGEFLRLVEWPAKSWCQAQSDLPKDLIPIAYDMAARGITNYKPEFQPNA